MRPFEVDLFVRAPAASKNDCVSIRSGIALGSKGISLGKRKFPNFGAEFPIGRGLFCSS